MLIEEKFLVKAPIQKVWDFLLDPKTIGGCIPGCEQIEAVDKNNFVTTVKVKLGPFSMRFKFKTAIKEANPPFFMRTVGQGEESDKKGHFRQETKIDFTSLSENETEISYRSEVNVVGKLATFGERIMRAKSKDLGKEFAVAVQKKLE
ncbi:MAG: SRPBCC domain-containing protein, partial [Thermodesulfobacteriota bacterium]|nr:SRPBCC domain-containing protein [Thermodesulfobacteriota bacterium]